jgi:ankyrin repeat protein
MEEDPGRQMMTGSFHPIDEGEWSTQAYLGDVEKLFAAIVNDDLETVRDILEQGFDLQRRDHVGRTSLHLALLSKSRIISGYLIDAGARITARLADGRTSLHLAAQLGMDDIVSKLLERSKLNEIKAEEEKAAAEAKKKLDHDGDSQMDDGEAGQEEEDIRASSEDDWDSDEEAAQKRRRRVKEETKPSKVVEDPQAEGAAIPEDNEELPDILDINVPDWDHMFSPLSHAIVGGHLTVVDVLLRAGSDAKTPFKKGEHYNATTIYPLTLTLLTEDEEVACAIAARLLESGASCTATDNTLKTVFHQAVIAGSVSLVRTFLQVDPNARTALDFLPQIGYQAAISPLVSAVISNNRAMVALLLSSGAKADITEEMFDKAWDARYRSQQAYTYIPAKQPNQWLQETLFPVEAALAQRSDLVFPLVKLGVDLNLGLRSEWNDYSRRNRSVNTQPLCTLSLNIVPPKIRFWIESAIVFNMRRTS